MNYAELQVTTHFSFLRGASSPAELFAAAALLGLPALGVTDRNSLAGIVRAYDAAKTTGTRLIVGSRLDLACGTSLLVYPTDRPAYSRLCRLLSIGKARAGKGACHLTWSDVEEWQEGLVALLVTDKANAACAQNLHRLRELFGDRAYAALSIQRRPNDAARLHALAELAAAARVPSVATGDVLYHSPDRRILQDIVTCIRERCTIDALGFRRERFADRHLKAGDEMARLFRAYLKDDAPVWRTTAIADRCRFSLDELRYQYPTEVKEPGVTAGQELERLTWAGARWRYGDAVPTTVEKQLRHELTLIEELRYAPYFLTVNSIVRFARSKDILCQGRGSAANSAVCYVLGITSIDPVESNLLFERFVSAERNEPPDIDVDFEHERREEVIQWIYDTYGRERAALCATFIRYRARGAVREVGKALGLPEDMTAALAGSVWGWSAEGVQDKHAKELNLDPDDYRLRMTLELSQQLIGTPRHLSQHPGGFVLTRDRLDELVPIEPAAMDKRAVIEWDKDDIDTLGFMKVDVLGLGMLGCMRRAFDLLAEHEGKRYDLATIPRDDEPTFRMIRQADTMGTFQIESRAQMAMLPRLKPRAFYDLVIQVAIVRPGPIQGDMVHPYLRRRENREKVVYPSPELEDVLGKTLGVPLFQEQAMKVAIVCAGFTPSEADQLRRSMATFKFTGGVSKYHDKLVKGMIANGYDAEFAERTFKQIEGFGSYGFPESHAASFAIIAYASSWMKCHHPDVFLAAILNAQPMGFYAPAQLVRDAREHGVSVHPIDVNHSRWEATLARSNRSTGGNAVQLGLKMVRGLPNKEAAAIIAARADRPFTSIEELWRRSGVKAASLEKLADAGAFDSLGLSRRDALWQVRALRDEPLPLFAAADRRDGDMRPEATEEAVPLVPMTAGGEVVEDYRYVGLTLREHPLTFLREDLTQRGVSPCARMRTMRDGRAITVAGLVLVRQRPGSANGVMFITLEDEGDIANIVVWPDLFEKHRGIVMRASMMEVQGRVQREGEVIHLVAHRLVDMTDLLRTVGEREAAEAFRTGRGDEARHGGAPDSRDALGRKPRDIYIPDLRLGSGIKVPTRNFR